MADAGVREPAGVGGDLLSLILSLRGWVSGWLWVAGGDGIQHTILVPQLPLLSTVCRLTEKSRKDGGAIMLSAAGAT